MRAKPHKRERSELTTYVRNLERLVVQRARIIVRSNVALGERLDQIDKDILAMREAITARVGALPPKLSVTRRTWRQQ